MKNLALYAINVIKIHETLNEFSKTILINDVIYAAVDNFVYKYCKTNLTRTLLSEHKCTTELCHIVIENKLFYGTGRELVYYCLDTGTVTVIKFPTEFLSAKWSPSQEILAVVTTDGRVSTYCVDCVAKELLPLGESNIDDQVNESYNVGWGSTDTQFRGSEGKKGATKAEEVPLREVTDTSPRIIWREDGEFFVVNYFADGKRIFKVYKIPCTLTYVSEDLPGLRSAIAWKCKGNMIACPTWTDKMRITIFEKNGLSTHSFCLYDQVEVEDLDWNNTGDVLAVHQKNHKESYLSLYTMSNYKWMLKQRLLFNETNPLVRFQWSEYSNNLFRLIVSTVKQVVIYEFVHKIYLSPLKVNGKGTSVVVNGNEILINNFAKRVIPPPYAEMSNISFKQPVSHVIFHPNSHQVLIIDCANCCYLLSIKDDAELIGEYNLETPDEYRHFPLNLHHFYWKSDDKLLAIGLNNTTGADDLLEYEINGELITHGDIEFNVNHISYIDANDSFLKLCCGTKILLNDEVIKGDFQTNVIMIDFTVVDGKLYIFCIDTLNQFFINGILAANSVTSFTIDDKYLIFTTSHNRLYCIRLLQDELEKISVYDSFKRCYSRAIENGGTLITKIPENYTVILQMPRGNLEIISCRIMVIDKLEELLLARKWNEGFELIRLERLNSNLLVDLDAERFLNNVDEFLSRVNSANLTVAFLLELLDENVLSTTYKNCQADPAKPLENKKKKVCEKIILCVNGEDIAFYIRVMMIACINVEGIDYAMSYLSQLFNLPDVVDCKKIILDGLQCLKLYFIDDVITKAALLTYDTAFAQCVFENSSVDPKYYKKLLDDFNSNDANEKHFKINDHLGNYASAVQYLARITYERAARSNHSIDDLTELVNYAEQHDLWKDVYFFAMRTKMFTTEVSTAYGNHLSAKGRHEEAGAVFDCVELWDEALAEYKSCDKWQEAISVIEQIKMTEQQKLAHVEEIAQNLQKINKYKDAGFLFEEYLQDSELAVESLLLENQFSEAVRVAYKFKRPDLLETEVKPAVIDYANCIRLQLSSSQTQFTQYKERLNVVRSTKTKKCDIFNEKVEFVNGVSYAESIVSGISTAISTRTRSSAMSSRSKRKEDLRKQDLRVGGFYEDIALTRALHQLIEQTFSLGTDVRNLCFLLTKFKSDGLEKSAELQRLLSDLQKEMKESTGEIWPAELNSSQASETPEVLALRQNLEFLEPQYRFPPALPKVSWQAELFQSIG